MSILQDEDEKNKLSSDELEFCQQYSKICEQHFKDSFLQFTPAKYQELNDEYFGK